MTLLKRRFDELLSSQIEPSLREDLDHLLGGVGRLLEVTSTLAAEIEPAKIRETITNEACRAVRCERASLYQYDPIRSELYTSYVTELEISEIRHGLESGITGHVARHRETVHVSDPHADRRWNATFDQQTGFRTRNILAVPVIAPRDGSLLGVLQLLNRIDRDFDEVDAELARAFSQHAAVALDRARLVEELRHRQTIQASLQLAREIQRGFMPTRLPNIPRYEIGTWWLPNEEIGGDYCDVIALKDGRTALTVADVSGHGLGPSLIMAAVRAALHALVLEHSAPEVLLNLLGRSIKTHLRHGRFITMVVATLDTEEDSVQYANAGHAPALHYQAVTGDILSLESTGMPLGVVDLPEYSQGWPIDLDAGDLIVLCTDGIVEAMDAQDKQFGLQRLEKLIRTGAKKPVQELVESVGREVEGHYQGQAPPDDLTILAIRRNR